MKQGPYTFASPYEHHSITGNPNTTIISDDFLINCTKNKIKKNYYESKFNKCVYAHLLVSNETGEIFDVNPIFKAAHELGMFVLCDMTQAIGNIDVDVKKINCDMAVFSGHKIHAPKGIGFAYINKNKINSICPLIYGTQQDEKRGGTENVAYIMSLAIAATRANEEIGVKIIKSKQFNNIILSELENSGIDFIVNKGYNNISETLNISLKGVESEVLQMLMSDKGIYIGVGSGCNNSLFEASRTLQEMNVSEEYIHGPIRFSYSANNTIDEVKYAIMELIKFYKELANA